MSMIAFTKNYHDHSNDTGFQFEFFCDKCGSGWRSNFQSNKMGIAANILGIAGSFFGGNLGRAAYAGSQAKDMFRGKAWDDAFAAAVDEGRAHFKQCSRCAIWACPDVCFNFGRGLCKNCAPDIANETASAQAHVAVEQVWDKARKTDQTGAADLQKEHTATCPHCGARAEAGKFCGECGKPLQVPKDDCGKCGAKMAANAKFCPECGTPRA